jgi:hypothetical protein
LGQKDHEKMLGAFRRRALDAADRKRREKRRQQDLQNTIMALREVTGLSRFELASIADTVYRDSDATGDRFFSVPAQFIGVAAAAIPIALGIGFLML